MVRDAQISNTQDCVLLFNEKPIYIVIVGVFHLEMLPFIFFPIISSSWASDSLRFMSCRHFLYKLGSIASRLCSSAASGSFPCLPLSLETVIPVLIVPSLQIAHYTTCIVRAWQHDSKAMYGSKIIKPAKLWPCKA